MRNGKKTKRALRKVYCIFVEGKTEKWYIELTRKYEHKRNKNEKLSIRIEPKLQKKSNLKTQKENVVRYSKGNSYDKVFWILDFDTIRSEQQKNFENVYKELKKKRNIIMLINNPCFEVWYLLHFKDTAKQFLSCKGVIGEIKSSSRILKRYEKSERYYRPNDESNNIYAVLKPYQKNAIKRAKDLDEIVEQNLKTMNAVKAFSKSPVAQIYRVIELFVE